MTLVKKLNARKCNKFETFELDGDYPNLIVDKLGDGAAFVHNVLTGENFFNSKTMEIASGLKKDRVSKLISGYYDASTKLQNMQLSQESFNHGVTGKLKLKLKHSDKPVIFHSFDVFTYVVFRSNKPEAIITRNWYKDTLNEKFNEYNNIDLVDMKAKNKRLKNKLQNFSLIKKMLEDDFNIALKNGHKEETEDLRNMIQMYDSKYNRLKTLTDEVDRWIRDEEIRRPRLNDIKNNELWSGGYDHCINPPTGFKFDREGRFVMNANQSIIKGSWE
jgi:hypothetical protein